MKDMKLKPKELELLGEYFDTYSTVPEFVMKKPKEKVIYIKKELIKKWFEKHYGEKNATPLNIISAELGFPKYGNSVEFRFLVASLVVDDYYPILSGSKGYFKAALLTEISNNIHTEEARMNGVRRRIAALEKIRVWALKTGMK